MTGEKSVYLSLGKVIDFFIDYPDSNLRFAREGWNGKDMYITLQCPDDDSKMTLPYIYLKTADGELVPWVASQTDLLAEDWIQLPSTVQ